MLGGNGYKHIVSNDLLNGGPVMINLGMHSLNLSLSGWLLPYKIWFNIAIWGKWKNTFDLQNYSLSLIHAVSKKEILNHTNTL
jgi:hypothetical protein